MDITMEEQTGISEYSPVEAGLQELRRKYLNIAIDVASPKALEEAKRVRAEIREPRYLTEKIRKELKAPALAHAKLIDTEAARITAELLAIETPWDEAIKAEEARKEAEKARREQLERERITAIHNRIGEIKAFAALANECRTAERVSVLLDSMKTKWVAYNFEDDFEEFGDEAQAAFDATSVTIKGILETKQADEAERARIKAEQAAATAALAEVKAAQEAEAKRMADERAAFEAERAAFQAMRDAVAAEAEAQSAREAKAIADMQDAVKELSESMAEPQVELVIEEPVSVQDVTVLVMPDMSADVRPTDLAIVRAIAETFDVDATVALGWISTFDVPAMWLQFSAEQTN